MCTTDLTISNKLWHQLTSLLAASSFSWALFISHVHYFQKLQKLALKHPLFLFLHNIVVIFVPFLSSYMTIARVCNFLCFLAFIGWFTDHNHKFFPFYCCSRPSQFSYSYYAMGYLSQRFGPITSKGLWDCPKSIWIWKVDGPVETFIEIQPRFLE